jgi:putative transposase
MDGKGAWRDNVFIERVWRSAKYEWIYLRAYSAVAEAKADIANYFKWYNAGLLFKRVEPLLYPP